MKRAFRVLACAVALALTAGGSLGAQALEPIRYTLRFPAPNTHYVEVEATVLSKPPPPDDPRAAQMSPMPTLVDIKSIRAAK